jgi:hypothetical protein
MMDAGFTIPVVGQDKICWYIEEEDGTLAPVETDTPDEVANFVFDFDSDADVQPFSFTINKENP